MWGGTYGSAGVARLAVTSRGTAFGARVAMSVDGSGGGVHHVWSGGGACGRYLCALGGQAWSKAVDVCGCRGA